MGWEERRLGLWGRKWVEWRLGGGVGRWVGSRDGKEGVREWERDYGEGERRREEEAMVKVNTGSRKREGREGGAGLGRRLESEGDCSGEGGRGFQTDGPRCAAVLGATRSSPRGLFNQCLSRAHSTRARMK